jgi:hypothetical protein
MRPKDHEKRKTKDPERYCPAFHNNGKHTKLPLQLFARQTLHFTLVSVKAFLKCGVYAEVTSKVV